MAMTAEMDKTIGSATYSLFCDQRGGIQGDLAVTRLGNDEFYVTTIALHPAKVAEQLTRVAKDMSVAASDCQIEDVTEAKAILSVNGPHTRAILSKLCESSL